MRLECHGKKCDNKLLFYPPRQMNWAVYLESAAGKKALGNWYVRLTKPHAYGKGNPPVHMVAECFCPRCQRGG